MVIIEMQHVSKKYPNGVRALSNISLAVEKGEFVFIVGSSGAGKSTLIKLFIREIVPDSGILRVNGKDIMRMKRREVPALRRSMGVVFQDFRLINDFNVFENVAFAMRVISCSSRDINRRVPEVLEMVGLSDKLYSMPKELSGGEQQRVCLARALVAQPALLLADEPTGNLDNNTAMEIVDILKHINLRGTTVIMATHARNIVNALQKRVIVLRKGALVLDNRQGGYGHDI